MEYLTVLREERRCADVSAELAESIDRVNHMHDIGAFNGPEYEPPFDETRQPTEGCPCCGALPQLVAVPGEPEIRMWLGHGLWIENGTCRCTGGVTVPYPFVTANKEGGNG